MYEKYDVKRGLRDKNGRKCMQQVKLTEADEKLVFSLSGEIDSATSDDFYAQVQCAFEHDKKDVVFDCSAIFQSVQIYIVRRTNSARHQTQRR